MLIRHIKVSGLLSFGPKGIDLSMRPLNVLIGPNGSGKSNFLEVLNLIRESVSPLRSFSGPVSESGGADEWMWKGDWGLDDSPPPASLSWVVSGPGEKFDPDQGGGVHHSVQFYSYQNELKLADERIEMALPSRGRKDPWWFYHMNRNGKPLVAHLQDSTEEVTRIPHDKLVPGASILTQVRSPNRYEVFRYLEEQYSSIQLYRDWSFGPHAQIRKPNMPDDRADSLGRAGLNLAAVAASMSSRVKKQVVTGMQILYPDVRDVRVRPAPGGTLKLYLEEGDEMEIPASRLSDGTLRYLALLLILLNPKPAPLIVIEEPELGLHPDVIPAVAKLLIDASQRTQLVVTTHSRMLIDALGDDPECVVVCEKQEGESIFERLDRKQMAAWLEKYSLGDLWSKGEIGGNRW
ncbi:AAA family ATPase [Luteolibacter arcticus]|uniref:AAA family ATPase n=1 Tax=Luteolibacter arcticus TaxID=1581411 RepID=A0ABT3GQR1_9BACT|nr:AAA family ATPase [Luteolibacter arcticus]MCW1925847.1 AAA family ATPase [Luteolibacter arcticus]